MSKRFKTTALFAVVLTAQLVISCGIAKKKNNKGGIQNAVSEEELEIKFNLALETYPDCPAIAGDLLARRAEEARLGEIYKAYSAPVSPAIEGRADAVMSENSAGPAAGSAASTNVQEQGVDENDSVKIGEHHIIVKRADDIVVLDRVSKSVLGYLPLRQNYSANGLYLDGKRLIVFDTGRVQTKLMSQVTKPQADDVGGSVYTTVRLYDLEAGKMPNLVAEKSLNGAIKQSRLTSGKLIMLIDDYFATPSAQPTDVACNRVVKPIANDADMRLVKILSLDVQDQNSTFKAVALSGGGDYLYMSSNDIFVVKQSYYTIRTSIARLIADNAGVPFNDDQSMIVTRVQLDPKTGELNPTAVGKVHGRIIGQWALKFYEQPQVLSIATTTGESWRGAENPQQNHLLSLVQKDRSLEVVGKVENFGTNENIRSVRHVGNTAYVVTFRQTDPLFAIDMTDAKAPKMLGELKVPGFSTYMHPVSSTRLIGFGYDATLEGRTTTVQLSLFDVADPMKMSRLAAKDVTEMYGASEAIRDHHAFMFDPKSGIVAVPFSNHYYKDNKINDTSGMKFFQIKGDAINELGILSHTDLAPDHCRTQGRYYSIYPDANRSYVIDGEEITVSALGLKVSTLDAPHTATKSISFRNATLVCHLGYM